MRFKSNNPEVERGLNALAAYIESFSNPEITVGKGMVASHSDGKHVVLEATGSGRTSSSCRKWQGSVKKKEEEGDSYVLVIRNGTVNGVLPSNVNEEVEFQQEELNYVLVEIEITAEGSVSECKIIVSEENLAGSQADEQGYPPSPAYVLVGTIKRTTYKAELSYSVSLTPVNTRKTAKDEVDFGQEPFDRWYKWEVRELEYGGG